MSSCGSDRSSMACIVTGETETGGGRWTAGETPMETFLPSYAEDVEISKTSPWCNKGHYEILSICRQFPKRIKSYLQEVWPMLESALKENDMSCSLNLKDNVVKFSTYKVPDLDNLLKSRELFQLLEQNVPACQALTIMKKGGLCPEFGMDREQFVELQHKLLPSKVDQMEIEKYGPSLNENGIPEANETISILRRVPKCKELEMEEAVPMVKSVLKEYGIPCTLRLISRSDQSDRFLKFSTTMIADLDSFRLVRELLLIWVLQIPAVEAIRVLNVRQWTIILTGDYEGGLCSDFGITREQFVERKKLLVRSIKALRRVTGCSIHIKIDYVVAIGTLQGIKLVKKIVEDCIVHKVPPAPRIQSITRTSTTMKKLEALRVCK